MGKSNTYGFPSGRKAIPAWGINQDDSVVTVFDQSMHYF